MRAVTGHEAANQGAPRGRYAPSPTGLMHVGNARTALAAWLSVRSRGGTFVWRLEDLDPPRIVAGAGEAAEADLAWLGLDWDEDPRRGGPFGPYVQSERSALYEDALQHLADAGRLFPCTLSRRELASISSAPHGGDDEAPYPASARPASLDPGWYERLRRDGAGGTALRFRLRDGRVDAQPVRFEDLVQGTQQQRPGGDFVLKRRDGLYAYHLAVVVDDWLMRIDEVVRGADLLPSTGRQIQLMDALGAPRPAHAHVPMVLTADGEKLSKRDGSLTLRALRESGAAPAALCGLFAWSLGLLERPEAVSADELVSVFDWKRIGQDDWRLPADFQAQALALR
jgi:glutamyl-tRNA synthetase